MALRQRLAKIGELVAVWVGFGLAIGATIIFVTLLNGQRLRRTPSCGLFDGGVLIQWVALVAFAGATMIALLYWALGAERMRVRVARLIVAMVVGVVLWIAYPEVVDDFTFACM
jgi:hypothetical protein